MLLWVNLCPFLNPAAKRVKNPFAASSDRDRFPSGAALFDKAQVRSLRCRWLRAKMARNHRHRRLRTRMIALAPLLKPALQIEIGQSPQARNISHALGVGAMTGIAGHDIGFRDSIQVDRSSPRRERAVAVIGAFRRDRCKIICQISCRLGIEGCDRVPHVLLRKWIIPRVLAEAPDLTHDVLRPLSSQPRRYRIALRPRSVTPGTVANGGALAGPRRSAGGEDRHDRHFQRRSWRSSPPA